MSSHGWSFQKALRNPAAVYETPEQVLSDPRLDTEGRRAILSNWASRLRSKTASTKSSDRMGLLRRIETALDRVEADRHNGRWSSSLRSRYGRS